MEEKRGFGMAGPTEPEIHRPRPFWARPMVWALFGALVGGGMFLWSQRGGMRRAARIGLPRAQAAAKQLASAATQAAATAQDLAKDLTPPEPLADELPAGPSAHTLSAPVDPSRPKRRAATGQTRSLAGRKRVGERSFKSADGVQDIRQRWDAPDVSYEAPVPWLETDMGRGVQQTGGLAIFFWLLGWFLMRFTSKREKTF